MATGLSMLNDDKAAVTSSTGDIDLSGILGSLGFRKRSDLVARATVNKYKVLTTDSANLLLATVSLLEDRHSIFKSANVLYQSILTFLWSIYNGVWEFVLPVIYNYWGILCFEVLFLVLWLASFALTFDELSDTLKHNFLGKMENGKKKNATAGMVAAAVFGLVEL
jgi:hypothetical protein